TPLQLLKTLRRYKSRSLRLLHHEQRTAREPAAIAQRGERFLREPLAVGRIEKHKRERLKGVRRAKIGGIAAEHLCDAAKPQRLDIVAQQRARLCAIVDKQRKGSSPRDRLDAERAGAGEEIEHAGALDSVVVGVDEDVEERLAQAVRGRTDRLRRRCGEIAAPQSPADHAHALRVPRAKIAFAVIAALRTAWRAIARSLVLVALARLFAAGPLHQHATPLAIGDQRALA